MGGDTSSFKKMIKGCHEKARGLGYIWAAKNTCVTKVGIEETHFIITKAIYDKLTTNTFSGEKLKTFLLRLGIRQEDKKP